MCSIYNIYTGFRPTACIINFFLCVCMPDNCYGVVLLHMWGQWACQPITHFLEELLEVPFKFPMHYVHRKKLVS